VFELVLVGFIDDVMGMEESWGVSEAAHAEFG
jgi:hypothetical protein